MQTESETENVHSINEASLEIPKQVCGFRIGDDFYGVSVLDVQEVIKPQNVTPIPLADKHVRGLINLRGQIVTSISLRTLFGLENDLAADHMNVIVRSNDSLFALVADEILDVMDLKPDRFEGPPETLDPNLKQYIKGVFKLENKLLILLDIEKILKG
ncbi:MAG: chemotaxis protein CheW [Halobacteriovoraceae bacterium]|jgi:purine-binding chemotaxis protein CheW|nr:chemotaxis protein CheW [Halobacteriovoraceae bacterium]MBT5095608.1 chemotaxis protein CheW [Halobacteriovoraceae bacterium]